MFVDHATLHVIAGRGGDGCVSFRREKYVPKGGPDGGDGGDGGSVILRVDEKLMTLLDLTQRQQFLAKNGKPGRGKNCRGASGPDLVLRVPPGTIVKDAHTELIIRDMTTPGFELVVAQGGKGGRGNKRFATSENQTPREAELGEPGEERRLLLELKLIADVGLVGMPNAGKSTLISRVSAAHPKIASYPFTTLQPQLGIVDVDGYRRFVMADIPGLIEGAHAGHGLGGEFLRHIERTKIIAHMIDMGPISGPSPIDAYHAIRREMELYSKELAQKPAIVVANKMDLTDGETWVELFRDETGIEPVPISAVTGQGVPALIAKLVEVLFHDAD